MKIQQRKWTIDDGWELFRNDADISSNCLVLVFGAREQIESCYEEISQFYP
ncbi:MAG: hypothetical protein ACI97N_000476, partial [Cognaticolwellia sp.]